MTISIIDIFTILGSLGLFLYGMKIMSQGIQKLAGRRLQATLQNITRRPVLGILSGIFITSLIQSSSATTVMVVGFANVGLLSLIESFGIIMGANIGTTLTSWLVSIFGFKMQIDIILLPLIGLGFFMMFFKKGNLKSLGEFFIGFALLFLGLSFLKSTVPELQNHPEIFEYLKNASGGNIFNLAVFVAIGTLITIFLQSSSATIALTIVLCNNGWIDFESAAAIVLGENLGTTATANIAALVGNVQAKKAALSHTLFNLFGILWMLPLFYPFINLINTVLFNVGVESPHNNVLSIPIALSMFHTAFNVVNTLIVLAFMKHFVSFIERLFNKQKQKETPELKLEYINSGYIEMSEMSLLEARKEMSKYAGLVFNMLNSIPKLLIAKEEAEFFALKKKVQEQENLADRYEVEITTFLIKLSNNELSEETAVKIRNLRQVSSYIEKIGDTCYKLSTLIEQKNNENAYFTPEQRTELNNMHELLHQSFSISISALKNTKNNLCFKRASKIEIMLNDTRDSINKQLFSDDFVKGNVKSAYYYNKLTESYEKIGDFLFIINKSLAEFN